MRSHDHFRIRLLWIVLLVSSSLSAQQIRAVTPSPASSVANSFSSPAVDAGDYVYVSGQGPRRSDGRLPRTFREQASQTLNNIKTIIEAAGLTMDNVVYTQVYLEDINRYDEMNSVFGEYFPNTPPARAVLGVAHVPHPPIEISAVAVRNLVERRAIYPAKYKPEAVSPGILTHDRLFISSMPGSNPETGKIPDDPGAQVDLALDRMQAVVKAAGLDLANMVFVNPYLTEGIPHRVMNERYARRFEFGNTPARATIEVSSLPGGAHIEYTGIAVRDLRERHAVRPKNMPPSPTASPCVFAGDTLYCSAKDGFIPGPHGGIYATTTPHQLRQTMRNLLDNLEEADMNFDQVVATNIYLDDLSDQLPFQEVYTQYFSKFLPSTSLIQQIPPTERKPDTDDHFPGLEQVSLIAIKSRGSH